MAANATATLTLRLKDLVSGPASGIKQAVRGLGPIFTGIGQSLRNAGFGSGFNLAAHLGQAGQAIAQLGGQARTALTAIITPAMDFEAAMARVGAITQNIKPGELAAISASTKTLGESFGQGPVEIARAYAALSVEGLNAAEQMSTLPTILRLTKVTGSELGSSIDAVTDLVQTFGLKMSDTSRIAGMLAGVSLATGTSVDSIYASLRTGAPSMLAAGASIEQVTTLVGLFADAGIKGSSSAMALNSMMEVLGNPSKSVLKALRQIGMSGKDLAEGLQNPATLLKTINERLTSRLPDQSKRFAVMSEIFGPRLKKSIPTLMNILGQVDAEGKTAFDRMGVAIAGGEAKLESVADKMGGTNLDKIKKLRGALEGLYIDLAENLTPVLGPMVQDLKGMIKGFADWAKANPGLVRTLGQWAMYLGAGALVMGPLTLAVSGLTSVFTLLRGSLVLVTGPFRIFAGMQKTLAKNLTETASVSRSKFGDMEFAIDGPTKKTKLFTKAMMGLNATVGLVGAAFVGWEVGKVLDVGIGKLAGAREGKVSSAMAGRMSESSEFNKNMYTLGKTFGITSLSDAALANMKINAERVEESRGLMGTAVPETPVWNSDKPRKTKPTEVTGTINIEVSDTRLKVTKLIKKGPVNLAVGQTGFTP